MTTTHHPGPIRHRTSTAEFGQYHEWLWIGLSIVLVAALSGIFAFAMTRDSGTVTTAPFAAHTSEFDNEATTGHIASPGVTTQYFGNSGELFREAAGSEYDHEATTAQIVSPGVTTRYFGNSGELFREAAGSEYDHEATTGHIASPGVTTPYFGNSGEDNPEK